MMSTIPGPPDAYFYCRLYERKNDSKVAKISNLVDLVRNNWHQIVEEQVRWRDLLYVEWNRHRSGYIPRR